MPQSYRVELVSGVVIYYTFERERFVTANDLRDRFNQGYYWDRAEIEHEFEQAIEYEELASEDVDHPSGTLSQIIIYHAEQQFVAQVHQYLLPGDERDDLGRPLLGGSAGMPDPKELIEDAVYYRIRAFMSPRRRPRW